jgi:uncharacterized protein
MVKRFRPRFTTLDWTVFGLTTIGALNWGLVGLFNVNLVSALVGKSLLSRIIYSAVGISGAWLLSRTVRDSRIQLTASTV